MLPDRVLIGVGEPDTSGTASAMGMMLSSCGPIFVISGICSVIAESAAVSMPKAEVKAMKLLVVMEVRSAKT